MSAVIHLAAYREARTQEPEKQRMQDGFVAIPNAVEDALLRSPLTQRQERVYRAILRKTIGFGKSSDFIASSQIADMTGIEEANARKAINDLIDMGMILRGRRTKFGTDTAPVLTHDSWNHKQVKSTRLPTQTGQIDPNKQVKSTPTIDNSTDNKPTTPCIPQVENGEQTEKPAKKSRSAGSKTFSKWMEEVKAAGQKPIPADDPIFEYIEEAGLPIEFLRMAWSEFRDRYTHEQKRYADWRIVFRKSVRECWRGFWYVDAGGQYVLTSKGQQAMAVMHAREAKQ